MIKKLGARALFRSSKRTIEYGGTKGILKLQPCETVEVRGEEDIVPTLDKKGTLEGLPFTSEMREYCGKRFKVLRRVDKILVEGIGMRNLKNTVILDGVNCDGRFHDSCQRNCLIFWKEAWLKRV